MWFDNVIKDVFTINTETKMINLYNKAEKVLFGLKARVFLFLIEFTALNPW